MLISETDYYVKAKSKGLVRDEHFLLSLSDPKMPKVGPTVTGHLRFFSAANGTGQLPMNAVAFLALVGDIFADKTEIDALASRIYEHYQDKAQAEHELCLALLRREGARVVFSAPACLSSPAVQAEITGITLTPLEPGSRYRKVTPRAIEKLIEFRVTNVGTTDNLDAGVSFTWAQLDKERGRVQPQGPEPADSGPSL